MVLDIFYGGKTVRLGVNENPALTGTLSLKFETLCTRELFLLWTETFLFQSVMVLSVP